VCFVVLWIEEFTAETQRALRDAKAEENFGGRRAEFRREWERWSADL
jgi:hypothetical protein